MNTNFFRHFITKRSFKTASVKRITLRDGHDKLRIVFMQNKCWVKLPTFHSPTINGLISSPLLILLRGWLCGCWKPSFLPLLIFDSRTFSRRVIARWWRQSAKNQVSTNRSSRNRWCHIVRRIICLVLFLLILLLLFSYLFFQVPQ